MPKKHCLIVEDDLPTSDAIADYLKSFFPDWEISQAVTQKAALRETLATRPDVIILDIALPDGDGLDIIRELAKSTFKQKSRFVVITALGRFGRGPHPGRPWMDQLESGERELVTAFFQKPFKWKEFLTALAQAADVPLPEAVTEFQEY